MVQRPWVGDAEVVIREPPPPTACDRAVLKNSLHRLGDTRIVIRELPALVGDARVVIRELPALVGDARVVIRELPALVGDARVAIRELPKPGRERPGGDPGTPRVQSGTPG